MGTSPEGIVLSQGNTFIKELLRERKIAIGATKDEFQKALHEAIDEGKLNPNHIEDWLNRVEGWGDQHVYLYRVPLAITQHPLWSKPEKIQERVKKAGLTKYWERQTSHEFPEERALTGIYFADRCLRITWHQGLANWARDESKDYQQRIDGDLYEFRAHRQRAERSVMRFEMRLDHNLAGAFIQESLGEGAHRQALDEVHKTATQIFDFSSLERLNIAHAVKDIDQAILDKNPDGKSIRANSTRLSSLGAYVQFSSKAGPITVSADDLISDWPDGDEETVLALLRAIASRGILEERSELRCKCDGLLTGQETEERRCASCGETFDSGEDWPITVVTFVREALVTRDVKWLLTIHGTNTTGAWQEEFNWRVSLSYGYSVPVAIYKYGIVRPGAFLRFRHKALRRELAARIKRLVGEADKPGFRGVPDVIAHSLGTLLLGTALRENPDLKVGRVILAGSILRPDFNWAALTERKQVEAVLNHFGTKDFWAGIAHYFIPDSGPSGRRGFNSSSKTIEYRAPRLGHNDFFALDRVEDHFNEVWAPFLTNPYERLNQVSNQRGIAAKDWKETMWILRATLPRFALLLLAGYVVFILLKFQALGVLSAIK